jgi:hypothetical protein
MREIIKKMEKNAKFILEKNAKFLIEAARRAPSGDNCQPFVYFVDSENTISIQHVESRARHYLNHLNVTSLISLGMVLESMKIEARALGYKLNIHLNELCGASNQKEWARVTISTQEVLADELAGSYHQRWTCREPFKQTMLSEETVRNCVEQSNQATSHVKIRYDKPLQKEFICLMSQADLFLWKHKKASVDFLKFIRFPGKEAQHAHDGMSTEELGIKPHEVLSLKLMRLYPAITPLFFHLGLKMMVRQVAKRNYLNSGGLVIFSVDSKQPIKESLIEVGKASMRVWLYLNQKGYVVQPTTTPTLLGYQAQNNLLPEGVRPEFKQFFSSLQEKWKQYFNVPENQSVAWGFRVGEPKDSTKMVVSKKLPIDEILKRS